MQVSLSSSLDFRLTFDMDCRLATSLDIRLVTGLDFRRDTGLDVVSRYSHVSQHLHDARRLTDGAGEGEVGHTLLAAAPQVGKRGHNLNNITVHLMNLCSDLMVLQTMQIVQS